MPKTVQLAENGQNRVLPRNGKILEELHEALNGLVAKGAVDQALIYKTAALALVMPWVQQPDRNALVDHLLTTQSLKKLKELLDQCVAIRELDATWKALGIGDPNNQLKAVKALPQVAPSLSFDHPFALMFCSIGTLDYFKSQGPDSDPGWPGDPIFCALERYFEDKGKAASLTIYGFLTNYEPSLAVRGMLDFYSCKHHKIELDTWAKLLALKTSAVVTLPRKAGDLKPENVTTAVNVVVRPQARLELWRKLFIDRNSFLDRWILGITLLLCDKDRGSGRPVGCVLASDQGILAYGWGGHGKNASHHAEICTVRYFLMQSKLKNLPANYIFYSSLKPCKMCAATIAEFSSDQVGQVIFLLDDRNIQAKNTALDTGARPQVVQQFGAIKPGKGNPTPPRFLFVQDAASMPIETFANNPHEGVLNFLQDRQDDVFGPVRAKYIGEGKRFHAGYADRVQQQPEKKDRIEMSKYFREVFGDLLQ